MRDRIAARIVAAILGLATLCGATADTTHQAPARDGGPTTSATGTGALSGRVMSDDSTDAPIRRARVTLDTDDVVSATTTTDDEGRFAFASLPPGRYLVTATKAAFVPAVYGATHPGEPGVAIALTDGQTVADLTLRMARGGVIAGHANGVVRVLRAGCSPLTGRRTLDTPPSATLVGPDENGTYRAFGLPAGDYIVMTRPVGTVLASPDGTTEINLGTANVASALGLTSPGAARESGGGAPHGAAGDASARVIHAPVYYPGTTDFSAAMKIAVGPGEEHTGIDLPAQLVPAARIDGMVTDASAPLPPYLGVALMRHVAPELSVSDVALMRTTETDASGAFHFSGVMPGQYTMLVSTAPIADSLPRSAPTPPRYATADVVVDGRDLHIDLALERAMTVTGRIAFDDTGRQPQSGDLTGLGVSLRPTSEAAGLPDTVATPSADGTLRFDGLAPGAYVIAVDVPHSLHGWWLKSATARGVDTLNAPLVVVAGADIGEIVLTFTDRPSAIAGRVTDAAGRPVSGNAILVFPTDAAAWSAASSRVRTTRPASDGSYSIVNLPAGEYWIAAVTSLTACDVGDASFLADVARSASRFTLADGEQRAQNFRIGGR